MPKHFCEILERKNRFFFFSSEQCRNRRRISRSGTCIHFFIVSASSIQWKYIHPDLIFCSVQSHYPPSALHSDSISFSPPRLFSLLNSILISFTFRASETILLSDPEHRSHWWPLQRYFYNVFWGQKEWDWYDMSKSSSKGEQEDDELRKFKFSSLRWQSPIR